MASSLAPAPRPPTSLESPRDRSERALRAALSRAAVAGCPPTLASALEYSVFPGGGRLRPTLCIVSATACGGADPAVVDAAAAAVELVHCASLAHDDLPCFDDAETRRGRPSLHKVYGEPIALLAGDALIVLAFHVLGRDAGWRTGVLVSELARAAGATGGIAAGQAWEVEDDVPLVEYHRAKTASLFAAAAAMGALAAGEPAAPWRRFGEAVGRAYQAADDLLDVVGRDPGSGKPFDRDAVLGRPNLVLQEGPARARARLEALLEDVVASVPPCPRSPDLQRWVEGFARRIDASSAGS